MSLNNIPQLLKQLINIKSVSGEEDEIVDFLYGYCEDKGFNPVKVDNNVIFSQGEGEEMLVFNAHIDTVGASGDWSHDPFGAEEEDGKIYGLGASDDKAQVAALLKTAEKLQGQDLDKEVVFMFVEKEEVDGSGTKKSVEWLKDNKEWEDAAAVIGEPTELEFVYEGHKGTSWIELTLEAEGGHASKDLNNPIEEVFELWKMFQKELEGFEEPKPKIELTSLEAGDSINKIPSEAKAKFDVRTVPGISSGEVMEKFEKLSEKLDSEAEIEFAEQPTSPSDSSGSEIVELVKKVTGIDETVFANGANDSFAFTEAGIKTAVVGPGNHDCIHKPDEFVEKEMLEPGVETYVEIGQEW